MTAGSCLGSALLLVAAWIDATAARLGGSKWTPQEVAASFFSFSSLWNAEPVPTRLGEARWTDSEVHAGWSWCWQGQDELPTPL
ncbi:uncharacterized protein C8Q71DRAFT_768541 [Rhodofomes roseus]|uniref:Secreted protein n=1 Tax=Rhodofomes roseus TaxID=34475 RepID=A0ABQ8KA64_9APHY|nr:uncharacterized protein C8Q71DRAFT_768541 [Rhodofomes roseus]KAH9834396.1 hypothetical protein C8Q71DRAFT_768541 [Rhodofomes roseus]